MKPLLFVICLALLQPAEAQKMPSDYFEEAEAFFNNGEYAKAIAAYGYIVENHKGFEYYPEAVYNLAYTNQLAKNSTRAKQLFKAILNMDVDDKKMVGGDIMASPFANYRHQSSRWLSEIYYEQKTFDSALYFLQLADTVYPYNHFCGNAFAENDIYLALSYADLYQKLGREEAAISALLKAIFFDDLADNSEVIRRLKLALRRRGIPLKRTLDTALRDVYTKLSAEGDPEFYFTFLGREIKAPYAGNETPPSKPEVVRVIKESRFYKELTARPAGAKGKGR